eukprot:TRINITY_DN5204_c0_g1_i1.p1 TRINITY_DN5204_c0_g1~~TRINITY_DN5204_c0_g1_i1.p1  ORF type:complete len:332 (+),score=52.30 TRINITY_DN5204_c0_g1_i1:16-1011(+)
MHRSLDASLRPSVVFFIGVLMVATHCVCAQKVWGNTKLTITNNPYPDFKLELADHESKSVSIAFVQIAELDTTGAAVTTVQFSGLTFNATTPEQQTINNTSAWVYTFSATLPNSATLQVTEQFLRDATNVTYAVRDENTVELLLTAQSLRVLFSITNWALAAPRNKLAFTTTLTTSQTVTSDTEGTFVVDTATNVSSNSSADRLVYGRVIQLSGNPASRVRFALPLFVNSNTDAVATLAYRNTTSAKSLSYTVAFPAGVRNVAYTPYVALAETSGSGDGDSFSDSDYSKVENAIMASVPLVFMLAVCFVVCAAGIVCVYEHWDQKRLAQRV